jgi:hypothetical protein
MLEITDGLFLLQYLLKTWEITEGLFLLLPFALPLKSQNPLQSAPKSPMFAPPPTQMKFENVPRILKFPFLLHGTANKNQT